MMPSTRVTSRNVERTAGKFSLMLAMCEYKFLRTDRQGVRMLVAAVSDCVVWFLIVIYRAQANERRRSRGESPGLR